MELKQFVADDERPVRTVPREDGRQVVADLGDDGDDPSVEVVGDTVIVARDEDEFDVELQEPVERAFIRNGVLTIDVEDHS